MRRACFVRARSIPKNHHTSQRETDGRCQRPDTPVSNPHMQGGIISVKPSLVLQLMRNWTMPRYHQDYYTAAFSNDSGRFSSNVYLPFPCTLSPIHSPLTITSDKQEFCKIPLTFELDVNPFQCHEYHESEPMFLTHAVMALAGHHVGSEATQSHRHAALQSLRESLDAYTYTGNRHPILDTVIILFSLDVSWSHLTVVRDSTVADSM